MYAYDLHIMSHVVTHKIYESQNENNNTKYTALWNGLIFSDTQQRYTQQEEEEKKKKNRETNISPIALHTFNPLNVCWKNVDASALSVYSYRFCRLFEYIFESAQRMNVMHCVMNFCRTVLVVQR